MATAILDTIVTSGVSSFTIDRHPAPKKVIADLVGFVPAGVGA